jgi:hypothetical protein
MRRGLRGCGVVLILIAVRCALAGTFVLVDAAVNPLPPPYSQYYGSLILGFGVSLLVMAAICGAGAWFLFRAGRIRR